jgi:hypothetical protein
MASEGSRLLFGVGPSDHELFFVTMKMIYQSAFIVSKGIYSEFHMSSNPPRAADVQEVDSGANARLNFKHFGFECFIVNAAHRPPLCTKLPMTAAGNHLLIFDLTRLFIPPHK